MNRWALVVALSVLFSGCAATSPPKDETPAPGGTGWATGYTFRCPPAVQPRGNGVCAGGLSSPEQTNQEPNVAVDPKRSERMAIGVNQGRVGSGPGGLGLPGERTQALVVYTTADGGATWTSRDAPLPFASGSVDVRMSSDPALVFDDAGTLHLSGLLFPADRSSESDLFYANSRDLGRTWSMPIQLTADRLAGRNWIYAAPDGTIYVPYEDQRDGTYTLSLAIGRDRGTSWGPPIRDPSTAPCRYPTGFLVNSTFHAVCSWRQTPGMRVYAFDLQQQKFTRLASHPEVTATVGFATEAAPGLLVMALQRLHDAILLTRSTDGGKTWSPPVDARESLRAEDGLPWIELMGLDADAMHGVHVMIKANNTCAPGCGTASDTTRRAVHAAFDPRDFRLLSETVLNPTDIHRSPPAQGVRMDDGYFGVDAVGGNVTLAWTWEHGVDFTHVVAKA